MNTETGEIIHADKLAAMPPEERKKYIEVQRPITRREYRTMQIEPYSPCACGSGKKFKFCCYRKPIPQK